MRAEDACRRALIGKSALELDLDSMPQIYDDDLVKFLQWALPRMGYRWAGFRKVRGQVKGRISDRLDELGIAGLDDYRQYLEDHPDEWERLDRYCYITISRFYRDRGTWEGLGSEVLPVLAQRARDQGRVLLRAASLGAASGEEPYTLRLVWELDDQRPWAGLRLKIDAIDAADHMVDRARAGVYPPGNLKELPDHWVDTAFEPHNDELRLRDQFRHGVSFQVADLRDWEPSESYDLIFCRNLAFMYFDETGRRETLHQLSEHGRPGAALVVGNHDLVPEQTGLVQRWGEVDNVWSFAV